MRNLSSEIERYLKELLAEEAGVLEVQRSVLSELFGCVPSQINYVLSTRFNPSNGYIVESKRGGGGYLRITAVPLDNEDDLSALIANMGSELNEGEGKGILQYLHKEGFLSEKERYLFQQLMSDKSLTTIGKLALPEQRAYILKHILSVLLMLEENKS